MSNSKKHYLGLIGFNGSGKTAVCQYLKHRGYFVLSLSDVVREHAKRNNLPQDRDTLTNLANDLKAKHGLTYFATECLKIADEKSSPVVFDSVRHPKEVDVLKDKGTLFIGIDSPIEVRYDRIKARKKDTDFIDFETFKAQDERERLGQSSGQNIEACLDQVNYHVVNDKELDSLYAKIDNILKKLERP